ncbi:hypothetical protein IGI04_031500, partial [Brassica rapa subsp. trilocularis]
MASFLSAQISAGSTQPSALYFSSLAALAPSSAPLSPSPTASTPLSPSTSILTDLFGECCSRCIINKKEVFLKVDAAVSSGLRRINSSIRLVSSLHRSPRDAMPSWDKVVVAYEPVWELELKLVLAFWCLVTVWFLLVVPIVFASDAILTLTLVTRDMKCLVSDSIFVGVQMEASCRDSESKELRPETRQLSVVGAGRIAVRSSFI